MTTDRNDTYKENTFLQPFKKMKKNNEGDGHTKSCHGYWEETVSAWVCYLSHIGKTIII